MRTWAKYKANSKQNIKIVCWKITVIFLFVSQFAKNRVSILLIRYGQNGDHDFHIYSSLWSQHTHTHTAQNRTTLQTHLIRDLRAFQNIYFNSLSLFCWLHFSSLKCELHLWTGTWNEHCFLHCIVWRMPREINNCVCVCVKDGEKSLAFCVHSIHHYRHHREKLKERVSSFGSLQFNRTLGHARFVYNKINTFEQFQQHVHK